MQITQHRRLVQVQGSAQRGGGLGGGGLAQQGIGDIAGQQIGADEDHHRHRQQRQQRMADAPGDQCQHGRRRK